MSRLAGVVEALGRIMPEGVRRGSTGRWSNGSGQGVVRLFWKTGSSGPAGKLVRVNLKHSLILEPLIGVLAELAASGDPEAHEAVCMLLPSSKA